MLLSRVGTSDRDKLVVSWCRAYERVLDAYEFLAIALFNVRELLGQYCVIRRSCMSMHIEQNITTILENTNMKKMIPFCTKRAKLGVRGQTQDPE